MQAVPTGLPGLLLLEPRIFTDSRGFFMEAYSRRVFAALTGFAGEFVQDNQSRSVRGVLRGLHYQLPNAQAKLVRVAHGEIYDVAVDLRRGSATFGRWHGVVLSAENRRQLWIPVGFAHGFLTLSAIADVIYKTSDYYAPEAERTLRWDDPDVGVAWPLPGGAPQLSDKDRKGAALRDAECFP